jgi:hypothetical protein
MTSYFSVVLLWTAYSILCLWRLTFKTAAQNICSRVTNMQSRTEMLTACGCGETVTVRSVKISWRNWSQRLTLQYHVVCVRPMVLGMLHTGTRESALVLSELEHLQLRMYYVSLLISCMHTYINTYTHTYIHTYKNTHTHTLKYIHTYIQAGRQAGRQTDRQTETHTHTQ